MQIRLSLHKFKKALAVLDKDYPDEALFIRDLLGIAANTKNSSQLVIDFEDFTREAGEKIAETLLEKCDLTSNQKLTLTAYLGRFASFDISNVVVQTSKEMYDALKFLNGARCMANIAVKMGSRCYPAHVQVSYYAMEGASVCTLTTHLGMGYYPNVMTTTLYSSLYTPPVAELSEWEREPINLLEWLGSNYLVPLTAETINATALKADAIERLPQRLQMLCIGNYVDIGRFGWSTVIDESRFGSLLHPEKVIVDADFEISQRDSRNRDMDYPIIPLVRVFSLRLKKYVFVDVDDLMPYAYDNTAINRLVINDRMRGLLTSIFSRKEELFSDVISGKHGGMVILANGPPGVGKTLTAEIMAEYTERPLYVMELGELGTNLHSVEEKLNKIFDRVFRWNALLLFDEADVFLHKRDDNLERSAIVGIFLRLLDYFPGVMFLTTNRAEVIDHAIKSRVTIKFDYPELDAAAREKIWKVMFSLINQTVDDIGELPTIPINGRQIRNLMRLAVSVHGKTVTPQQIYELSEFTAK